MRETEFYREQIEKNFWPYWERHIDLTYGGVLNCLNNDGDELLSENKYSWSQGRFLWILASLYELSGKGKLHIDSRKLRKYMDGTLKFILNHCFLEDKSTVFLLERDGKKIKDSKLGRYDTSIYSDCFVIIGICKYAQNVEDESLINVIEAVLSKVLSRISTKHFLTEPYPIPEGYRTHGVNMIMVNTLYEVIRTLDRYRLNCDSYVERINEHIDTILFDLYDEGLIREFASDDLSKEEKLLDRHLNPGHTLESMWFIIEYLEAYQNIQPYIDRIGQISLKSFDMGWDQQYGGLLRFVDREGGMPKGESASSQFEILIADTHDMKLWWPQSEALVLFHKLYSLTDDEAYKERYDRMKAYAFSIFPNEDVGEWIQIRVQNGSPYEKNVALPVKDPFHILRAFIKIMEIEQQ